VWPRGGRWMSWICSVTPIEAAACCIAFTCNGAIGSARYDSTSNREIPGTASFNIYEASPTGSPSPIMTIGIVRVAFLAA
jgi:hypothetical protein